MSAQPAKSARSKAPTSPMSVPASIDGLPKVTDKQYAYIVGRIDGKGMTEAYRDAYDPSSNRPETDYAQAWRQEHHPAIAQWLQAARAQGLIDTRTTREAHSARLAYLSRQAENAGNYSAAIAAETNRGKLEQLYVDVVRHEREELDVNRFLAGIAMLLGDDLARTAAQKLGVEYKPAKQPRKLEQSGS